jgi:hypothetical protein
MSCMSLAGSEINSIFTRLYYYIGCNLKQAVTIVILSDILLNSYACYLEFQPARYVACFETPCHSQVTGI